MNAPILNDIAFTFSVILVGFSCGLIIQHQLPNYQERLRSLALTFSLKFAMPAIIVMSIWNLGQLKLQLLVWPLLGLTTLMSGAIMAFCVARLFKLSKSETGALLPVGGFSNLGAIGSFSVLSILGEPALALVPLYKLFEEAFYYGALLPFIKRMTGSKGHGKKDWYKDPILIFTFAALCMGLSLNVFQIPRPDTIATTNHWLVPFFTFSLLVAVGSGYSVSGLKQYFCVALTLAVLKQLLLPIVITFLFWLVGYQSRELQFVFILTSMPTAFIAVIPAQWFKLELGIANTGWAVSSVMYLILLPWLFWGVQWL